MTIKRPTLVIAEQIVRNNIRTMTDKAKTSGVEFRPHFKTHQSAAIGEIYRDFGISQITVSSVSMAQYFANHGWDDITIAFPVNLLEIDEINSLAADITLHLLVESVDVVEELDHKLDHPVNGWIKVDVGYRRTGIPIEDDDTILHLVQSIDRTNKIDYQGILTHAGHSYNSDTEKKTTIFEHANVELPRIQTMLSEHGYPTMISYGDTPTCSIFDNFSNFDEIRPGNFVYYDLMQFSFGSCQSDDIAVAVACPIVAIHGDRHELLIYGGGVHFSKDNLQIGDRTLYGYIVDKTDDGWGPINQQCYLKSISQEHGIASVPDSEMGKYSVGDILYILPVHSCMTADLLQENQILL